MVDGLDTAEGVFHPARVGVLNRGPPKVEEVIPEVIDQIGLEEILQAEEYHLLAVGNARFARREVGIDELGSNWVLADVVHLVKVCQ